MKVTFNSSHFFGLTAGKITNIYNTGRNSMGSKIRSWHGKIENPNDKETVRQYLKALKCTCIEITED